MADAVVEANQGMTGNDGAYDEAEETYNDGADE